MKTTSILSILSFTLLGLCGCDDFLDIKPKGKDIPEKIAHYEGLLNNTTLTNLTLFSVNANGSISPKQTELYYIYMTDELMADAASFANMERSAQAAYSYDPDIFLNEDYSAEWSAPYHQIYLYNVVINGVLDAGDGTPQKKKEILAEARVGRAFMHFYLAQFFCKPYNKTTAAQEAGIPIVTKASSGETSFVRGTMKEVYDFVLREMEEACPDLPLQTQNRQRLYRSAGYFVLGKVYMAMGEYDNALQALQIALQATKNATVEIGLYDYNTEIYNWGYNPLLSFMWGLTCSYPTNLDAANIELIYNKQISVMTLSFFAYPPMVYVKPEYMALYSPNDHRAKFFNNRDYSGSTQWPYYKRIGRMMYSVCGDLPDLYLMLAECKARGNDEAGARADLLTLRKNRMPDDEAEIPASVDSKEELIRFVVEERMREYMMSGMRWFDMRRLWNDPLFRQDKENYIHTDGTTLYRLTEDRITYRIPPRVMLYNKGWENNK